MEIKFHGQVVLVTGATRGIGKQIAQDIARLGATVIITGTRPLVRKKYGGGNRPAPAHEGSFDFCCADFTDEASTAGFLGALERYDRIDVCINNAGINRISFLNQVKTDDWDDILNVNLKAPFLITQAVSRKMMRHGYGRIVNIGSVFGLISKERRAAYSTSKFGLRGLTVATSNELAKHDILVNTVSPGFVLTDLTKRILKRAEIARLKEQVPLRRLGTPQDISNVVLFLASSANTYITGQNIIVDGGYVNV